MLVLSRKQNQKILFPTLGVSVEILGVSKNTVKVGVEAPPTISIVRAEIAPEKMPVVIPETMPNRHEIRNRLHTASLAIHLAQRQLRAGLHSEAEKTLDAALQEYMDLDQQLSQAKSKSNPIKSSLRHLLWKTITTNVPCSPSFCG